MREGEISLLEAIVEATNNNDRSSFLKDLNSAQREAVTHIEGPLLVLAGAGSGKTRVIAYRIAYLLEKRVVRPWQILAVTFTNKAAREMRERVEGLGGPDSRGIWMSTFHSFGARFVRREGEKVGIPRDFAILDEDDRRQFIRQVLKDLGLKSKDVDVPAVANIISRWKNRETPPDEAREEVRAEGQHPRSSPKREVAARVYEPYEQLRRRRRALDFDDLLLYPLRILRDRTDIRNHYQDRFHHILVDEYQDTNRPQHALLQILAAGHRNICVVGDDDQSIYGWRGAEFQNILNFDADFPGTHVVRLEQNYRSTANILTAAGGLVQRNRNRRGKELFTVEGPGYPIKILVGMDAENEAEKVAREIRLLQDSRAGGPQWHEVAVLYRTSAQSRALEAALAAQRIPYQVVGGTRFYERKEVKDALAYLRLVANPEDDLALERIINVPPRGVGPRALTALRQAAGESNGAEPRPLFPVLERVEEVAGLPKSTVSRLRDFVSLIHSLRERAASQPFLLEESEEEEGHSGQGLPGLVRQVMDQSGLLERLREQENDDAVQNLDELASATAALLPAIRELLSAEYPDQEATNLIEALRVYLEMVSLLTDIDLHRDVSGAVNLMTLHSAKGLEFPIVFVTGLEEGLLPHFLNQDRRELLEEERRLCYVGITRAKERCYLTRALQRMVAGTTSNMKASRFLNEVPQEVLEYEDSALAAASIRIGQPSSLFGRYREEDSEEPKTRRAPSELGFAVGDTVRHRTFGPGEVTRVEPVENTHRVTVRFERFGEKVFLQRIARMVKV